MAKKKAKIADIFASRGFSKAATKQGEKYGEAIAGALGNRGMPGRVRIPGDIGKTINEGWLSKLFAKGKTAMKTPEGAAVSGVLGYMLIDMLAKQAMGIGQQIQQGNLQGQALDAQAAGMAPEAVAEKKLQPITKAQRQHALMMLMKQMGGDVGPMLADGEVYT